MMTVSLYELYGVCSLPIFMESKMFVITFVVKLNGFDFTSVLHGVSPFVYSHFCIWYKMQAIEFTLKKQVVIISILITELLYSFHSI